RGHQLGLSLLQWPVAIGLSVLEAVPGLLYRLLTAFPGSPRAGGAGRSSLASPCGPPPATTAAAPAAMVTRTPAAALASRPGGSPPSSSASPPDPEAPSSRCARLPLHRAWRPRAGAANSRDTPRRAPGR